MYIAILCFHCVYVSTSLTVWTENSYEVVVWSTCRDREGQHRASMWHILGIAMLSRWKGLSLTGSDRPWQNGTDCISVRWCYDAVTSAKWKGQFADASTVSHPCLSFNSSFSACLFSITGMKRESSLFLNLLYRVRWIWSPFCWMYKLVKHPAALFPFIYDSVIKIFCASVGLLLKLAKYMVICLLHCTYFDLSPSYISGFAKTDFPSSFESGIPQIGRMLMCNRGGCCDDGVVGRCTWGERGKWRPFPTTENQKWVQGGRQTLIGDGDGWGGWMYSILGRSPACSIPTALTKLCHWLNVVTNWL